MCLISSEKKKDKKLLYGVGISNLKVTRVNIWEGSKYDISLLINARWNLGSNEI